MARYFLEFVSGTCILHKAGCFTYESGRDQFAWERMEPLGEHADYRSALRLAAARYPACSPCWCCLSHSVTSPPRRQQRRV